MSDRGKVSLDYISVELGLIPPVPVTCIGFKLRHGVTYDEASEDGERKSGRAGKKVAINRWWCPLHSAQGHAESVKVRE